MAKVDRLTLEMEEKEKNLKYDGIQRQVDENKVASLEDYIESPDATFPNSIILNVEQKYVRKIEKDQLEIEVSDDTFSVIDGQHRLEGFRKKGKTDFELVVSIFIGLSIEEQARIFTIINSEQTKVNPSIQLFQELHDTIYTPRKMAAEITLLFSNDLESPWFNKIKLLGTKDEISPEGIISLSAFVRPIINYIYNDNKYHYIRTIIQRSGYEELADLEIAKGSLPLFWKMYITRNEKALYKILFNYFKAVSRVLKKDWKDKKSLLTKTTGYNAVMYLFKDVFEKAEIDKDLSEERFTYYLTDLKKVDGKINSKYYGTSGQKASKDLYQELKRYIR